VAYNITYQLYEIPDGAAYFHAQWRQSITELDCPAHVILDDVSGRGNYVGTYLAWNALSSDWWGEGEVKFFIDGDTELPTMAGTGTEDYFGGAWGFTAFDCEDSNVFQNREQSFNSPFLGLPLVSKRSLHGPRRYGMYRWHIADPIGFVQDIRVLVQTLGWQSVTGMYKPLSEDIRSVAYWYQIEPHTPFPTLVDVSMRWDR
jgi:hypothetical protein